MTKKVEIPYNVLEELYINKGLSTHQIAKKFNCYATVIQDRLKEYGIKVRKPKEKIIIPQKKLKQLYSTENLSTYKIAKKLGISSCSVYYKLKEAGIKTRPKKIIKISKERLRELYWGKNLSCSKIANHFDCDTVTIFEKLKKYNIALRNASEANTIYPKKKFDGNDILKAYMIGFRLGDLNAKARDKNSTVMIKSNTTKIEQCNLIKRIYGRYGHYRIKKGSKGDYCIWINLDKSFYFLVPKQDKIEDWIYKDKNIFFSFLAGYTDAEGNISISSDSARFRIRTYDKNILFQIYKKLNALGINTKFGLASKKGYSSGQQRNQDCWGVYVYSKKDILNLLQILKPLLKHKKRYNDLILAEKNVLERNKKYEKQNFTMKNKKTFYITTPIYYANAPIHLGGAYTTIAADVLARWHKLLGEDVFFLTGTDEHGQKIQETAEKAGLKPKEFVDKIAAEFKEAFKMLDISNDNFIRTTDKYHEEEVKHLLNELFKKKLIYKGFYESYYCVGCEQYLTEADLVDGKCPLHNREPELKKEETYLFKLSAFEDKLLRLIKTGEYNILPKIKRKEIINFIESGLKDVSISRLKEKISWGIELPFDKKHCVWVWPDAFWNYVSGLRHSGNKIFEKFWPADVQLMARDILRVHATIWPALLLGAHYKLPKTLFVHGYFTINGQKMSKSLGNVIDPVYLTKTYGVDGVRYYLMRSLPFGSDGDVSESSLVSRYNNELADKLGNLVSRVSALAEKYGVEKCENKLLEKLKLKEIEKLLENYELDKALNEIFAFIDRVNEFVQASKPWESHDTKVLYQAVDSIKAIAILLWAFIPETCEKIAKTFGFEIKLENINKKLDYKNIKKAEILFKKIEFKEDKNEEKVEKKEVKHDSKINKSVEGIVSMADLIKYDDFAKLDLRVGTIKKAEDIEGADKLYKLEVDVAESKPRIICAGIKKFYSKDELKGKQIIVICNLEPRKMKGIESNGMLLAASNSDDSKVILLAPEKKIDSGSKVR